MDAGFHAMIQAIYSNRTPNLLVLQYSASWCIQNLLLVPRFFFTESVIEKRRPLGIQARRAGWVGCNILLGAIPSDGKISIIEGNAWRPIAGVRHEFRRTRPLAKIEPNLRGWTLDVLKILRKSGKQEFSLADIYAFEPELRSTHPANRHIRPKIRQQLQVLRDLHFLTFVSPGRYRLTTA